MYGTIKGWKGLKHHDKKERSKQYWDARKLKERTKQLGQPYGHRKHKVSYQGGLQ